MRFWNRGGAASFNSDVEVVAEACLWLKSLYGKSFDECVSAIRKREWRESYHRKAHGKLEYGFFICNDKFSGHLHNRGIGLPDPDEIVISLEAHAEYYGLMMTILEDGIYSDLKESVQKLGMQGKSAAKLLEALMRRKGFEPDPYETMFGHPRT